jgi:mitochondrial import inner membrane translocase subunit TIM23
MSSDAQKHAQNEASSPGASSSADPTAYLRSATFSQGDGLPTSPEHAVTASDLLLGAYDPAKLHPLADIGDKLDYLLLDDDKTSELPGADTAVPSRGWSDDLCYGTGTMYLSGMWHLFLKPSLSNHRPFWACLAQWPSHLISNIRTKILIRLIVFSPSHAHYHLQGLALGGVWGVREGARRPLAVSNARLRINSILNSVTRRGTFIGNSAGVLGRCQSFPNIFHLNFANTITKALVYNGINSTIDSFRGKHDIAGSMTAGGLTGALYKSTGARCGYADVHPCINVFCFLVSWRQTCDCRGNFRIGACWHLELCEKERLII